jgi:hypothetical protein
MFDDFHAYFYENVIATYQNYKKIRYSRKKGLSNDLRAAVQMAEILFHLREHLPDKSEIPFKKLIDNCPDYLLVKDIANLSKHKKIDRNNPQISNSESIVERLVYTTYRDKQGEYTHTNKEVVVRLDNGLERDLFEINTNVLNMWLEELSKAKLINSIKPFPLKRKTIPKRRKRNDFKISILSGVRYPWSFKFQKYNYEKKQIEPIDITGHTVELKIFEQKYDITLMVINDKTGHNEELTFQINEKQNKELLNMNDDKQRMSRLLEIAKEQGLSNSNIYKILGGK